jgi:predicted ATP-dependent serine protease
MILNHNYTNLKRANEIEIPDIYFNRLKTGIESIDAMFGEGILPGSTFTVDAAPGTGKSTLLLQLCQLYAQANHEVAFLSGEENVYMVAMRARRLDSGDVAIAMENRLSKILNTIANNELVIIDSYPSIIYDLADAENLSRTEREEKKLIEIIKAANCSKCAVGIILHVTKSGTYKGSTMVQHAVDVNISILRDDERPDVRIIDFTKNRMGCAASYEYYFGGMGYDFNKQVEAPQEEEQSAKGGARGNARIEQMQAIMSMDEPPHINVARVCEELSIDAQRATYLLWLLVKEGKLEKYGRGDNAVWKFSLKMQNVVEIA